MKKWQKVVSIVGVVGLSFLFVSPEKVQAEDLEEFVQFSDVDIRYQVSQYSLKELENNYDKAVEVYNLEYENSEKALAEKHKAEFDELDKQYLELEKKLASGELSKENYQIEVAKLDEKSKDLDKTQVEEFENLYKDFDKKWDELDQKYSTEHSIFEKYQIITKSSLASVDYIGIEPWRLYPTVNGIEYLPNLTRMTGEKDEKSTYGDLRPFIETPKLEELDLPISNQTTLNSLKNLVNLKKLSISAGGFMNYQEMDELEEAEPNAHPQYTQALLTDISALDNAKNLQKLYIKAEGAMPTVTLKKGTTSYQLYDPIILSTHFDGAEITYNSYLENDWGDDEYSSDSELKWENLTGEEGYLSFDFDISNDEMFNYSGQGQIPIRWK